MTINICFVATNYFVHFHRADIIDSGKEVINDIQSMLMSCHVFNTERATLSREQCEPSTQPDSILYTYNNI